MFNPLRSVWSGATLSSLVMSTLAIWSRDVRSRVFSRPRLACVSSGELKSRDLKSRDHIARVDITRLDNVAPDQTIVSEHDWTKGDPEQSSPWRIITAELKSEYRQLKTQNTPSVCPDSTAALTVACSFGVQSAILSEHIRSPYSRGTTTTAAAAAAARTKTRPVRRPCQQWQLQCRLNRQRQQMNQPLTTAANCASWRHVLASHWCRADMRGILCYACVRYGTVKHVSLCQPSLYGLALSSLAMWGLAFSVAPVALFSVWSSASQPRQTFHIFTSYKVVLQFQVLLFHALQFVLQFSSPSFSVPPT